MVKDGSHLAQAPSAVVLGQGLFKNSNLDRDDLDLDDNFSAAVTAKMPQSAIHEQPPQCGPPFNKHM